MDKEQRLHAFWSGFSLPAYDENTVPEGAVLPYITYNVSTDDFGEPTAMGASLWYRSTSWSAITAKAEEIFTFIGQGGCMGEYDGGAAWIKRRHPFSQRMSDPDAMIRRIYLQVEVEFLSED